MKRLALFTALAVIGFVSNAQAPLGEGGRQLNFGLGLSDFGVPVYAGIDFGVHEDVTIGPQLSYRRWSEGIRVAGVDVNYDHSITVIGFNGNYHFNTLLDIESQWDVYAGLTLNYYIWSSPSNYPGNRDSGLGLDVQLGGRYFFSNQWAINLELGGGTGTGGKFGVTYLLR